jgi:hypothetical protein
VRASRTVELLGGGITPMNATRVLTKEIDDVSSRSILAL